MLLAGLDCLLKKFPEAVNAVCLGGDLCDTGQGTREVLRERKGAGKRIWVQRAPSFVPDKELQQIAVSVGHWIE